MARQAIDIGTSANDGTGDPLRTAMDKSNDNFAELYQARTVIATAQVRQAAGISIADGTRTQITIDTTDWDDASIVSGNTLVIPANLNIDSAILTFAWQADDASGNLTCRMEITKNSTSATTPGTEDTHGAFNLLVPSYGNMKQAALTYSFEVTAGDVFRFYFTPDTWTSSPADFYAVMSIVCFCFRETP